MLRRGTLVSFIGNEKAEIIAVENHIVEWFPDNIPDNTIGICERSHGKSTEGYKLYSCRFPIISHTSNFSTYRHMCGLFYEFELMEAKI